ncbi:MAG: extracellular solute-binding protein [Firmicutes bacterium]|nr:extracellular solute-binding protein [Bacillota bacterium]
MFRNRRFLKPLVLVISLSLVLVLSIAGANSASSIWQQCKGKTVRVLLDAHPWQQAIEKHLDEFTKLTGIRVELTVLGEDTYWDRVTLGLSSPNPPFDVFKLSPNQTGFTGYQNNWIAPLDGFINNKKYTDPAYNFKDFYSYIVEGFRFPDTKGKLYAVPLTIETYMLFYRKDLLAEQNIDQANLKTMDDWIKALDKLQAAYAKDGIAPAVIRGQDPTMPDELLAAVYNYWGKRPFLPQRMFYFDKDWNPRFTDPAIVNGFKLWAKLLSMGPKGSTSFTWYDCVHHFASGKAATFWFDASVFAGIFEDPKQSKVVGKVGYAPVPPTATGHGTTHWGWGLSIAQNSPVKDAAWLFVQWATSPQMEKLTAPMTYGPVRRSSWKSLRKTFGSDFCQAVDTSLAMSVPGYMYFPGAREVADRIIDAVIRISQGEDANQVMNWLDSTAKDIVKRNGLR